MMDGGGRLKRDRPKRREKDETKGVMGMGRKK